MKHVVYLFVAYLLALAIVFTFRANHGEAYEWTFDGTHHVLTLGPVR